MTLATIIAAFSFSTKISAHDAGISSVNVELAGQTLTIVSDYSSSEIGKISPMADEGGLATLSKESVVLIINGKPVAPKEVGFNVNQGHDVIFRQVFTEIEAGRIELQSALLVKLGSAEHRQYAIVRRDDGEIVGQEILTADQNSMAVDFKELKPDTSFSKFLPLGIEHIVFGYDHLLFLFALLLVVKSFGEIAKIVTSFTVAHSITLSLATLNVIQVSPSFIEPLIAVSIIFVGLENLLKADQKNRWMLTYAFGLIHGFGFASALQAGGIGQGVGVVVPLLSFNLGVELGQIAVVLLVLPVLWKLGQFQIYKTRLVPIGSCLVVVTGIYWLIERTLF